MPDIRTQLRDATAVSEEMPSNGIPERNNSSPAPFSTCPIFPVKG